MRKSQTLISRTVEETREIGRQLAAQLRPGDVIALRGGLGVGKTTLSQAIGAALGIRRPLRSPTFVVVSRYPIRKRGVRSLNHVDLYRLRRIGTSDAGLLQELISEKTGVVVIEWADRLSRLPPHSLRIDIQLTAREGRLVRLSNLPRRAWKWPERSVLPVELGRKRRIARDARHPRQSFARP